MEDREILAAYQSEDGEYIVVVSGWRATGGDYAGIGLYATDIFVGNDIVRTCVGGARGEHEFKEDNSAARCGKVLKEELEVGFQKNYKIELTEEWVSYVIPILEQAVVDRANSDDLEARIDAIIDV